MVIDASNGLTGVKSVKSIEMDIDVRGVIAEVERMTWRTDHPDPAGGGMTTKIIRTIATGSLNPVGKAMARTCRTDAKVVSGDETVEIGGEMMTTRITRGERIAGKGGGERER